MFDGHLTWFLWGLPTGALMGISSGYLLGFCRGAREREEPVSDLDPALIRRDVAVRYLRHCGYSEQAIRQHEKHVTSQWLLAEALANDLAAMASGQEV